MANLSDIDKIFADYKQAIANINNQLKETPKKVFENGEYCIWLISLGDDGGNRPKRKLEVMAKIKEIFSKGIAENKRLVENLPSKLGTNLSYNDCLNIQNDFNFIGCETKILKVNEPLYEGEFKLESLSAIDEIGSLITVLEQIREKKIEVVFYDADKENDTHEFELLVNSNTERTYTNMVKNKTEAPYLTVPANIENRKSYSCNRKKYITRINKEQKEFNNSLNLIIKKRKDRQCMEENNRIKRELNRKKFFFALSQLLITLICILPILFIDYVGIKYIIADFSGNAFYWIDDWMVKEGYPRFLAYLLQIPVWGGVAYIGLAAIIKKIGKKTYTEANFKKYAQSRWVLMLILSIIEAIVSCICLGL